MNAQLTAEHTRLNPAMTKAFGVAELHAIHFAPSDDQGGPRNAISILVPAGLTLLDQLGPQARQRAWQVRLKSYDVLAAGWLEVAS